MPTGKIRYGNFGGNGSRFKAYPDRPPEAWVLDEARTKWLQIPSGDHGEEVREMTKQEFEKKFPNAPPLPPIAFSTD
jgi:hypothetical protein